MTQDSRRMYEKLKQLWLSEQHDDEARDDATREFDDFIGGLLKQGAEVGAARRAAKPEDEPQPEEQVSQSRMLMEIILEVDTTMRMVPSRVKAYRDLLAQEGLDRTSEMPGENGQKGIAGINLADQAALEFHRAILGLAISIASAEAQERMEKLVPDGPA